MDPLNKNFFISIPEEIEIAGTIEDREVTINGEYLDPRLSQKISNHSPDGFNWGYGGSGPAQLSLAILLKVLPVDEALDIYQDFKFNVVASWPRENFKVTVNLKDEIKKILDAR